MVQEGYGPVNTKNVLIVYLLFATTLVAFFWGGYHDLRPTLFLAGLFASSVVSVWGSMMRGPRSLIVLMGVTLVTGLVDEYAHTRAGAFAYFDGLEPSPLTVFGWSLFVLNILTVARFIEKIVPLKDGGGRLSRAAPCLVSIALLVLSMYFQGYIPVMSPLLVVVYALMGAASLYYSSLNRLSWNFSVMTSAIAIGVSMEFIGAMEGMWSFRFMEPLSLFMAFTWSLRTWTILSVSRLLGAVISD